MNDIVAVPHCRPKSSCTLLTGATGLLGQYLLRDLLLDGHRVAVVVRARRNESALQRVEQVMSRLERDAGRMLPRPTVLSGDIREPGLGLNADDREFVRQHCDSLIHNAAALKFHGSDPDAEPWLSNVSGTRNALELARSTGIGQLHYISTAYVCGCRTGTILESEFERGQDFRNDYERSKFTAERLVRESTGFSSTTIYRPVVVAGDSATGFTSSWHGLYVYLRLMAMFVPGQERGPDGRILTPVQIPLDGDEPRNVVPVDWVSTVFCRIFANPRAHGRTYHLAPEHRLTPRQVIESCYEYFNSHGVSFCGADYIRGPQPDYAEKIFDNIAIYQQYETSDPTFDTANLRQFADLPCPPIDKAMIHRYLEFGEECEWGRGQRVAPVAQPAEPAETMRRFQTLLKRSAITLPFAVRIAGPGGGDWTVGCVSGNPGVLQATRGCGRDLPVIEIDVTDIDSLAELPAAELSRVLPGNRPVVLS